MKKTENQFMRVLEARGRDQAQIEASSPLPESFRPLASFLGEKPWQTMLLVSFVLASLLATWQYSLVLKLFNRGVLAWLLR